MVNDSSAPRLPRRADYWRSVIGMMILFAREWGVPVEELVVAFGQSPTCAGRENNYQVRHGARSACVAVAGRNHRLDERIGPNGYEAKNLTRYFTYREIFDLLRGCDDQREAA